MTSPTRPEAGEAAQSPPMGSDEVLAALEHIAGAAMDIRVERLAIAKAAREALAALRQQSHPAPQGEVRMLTDDRIKFVLARAHAEHPEMGISRGLRHAKEVIREFCSVNGIRLSGEKGGEHHG